jgi:hypothetical protein
MKLLRSGFSDLSAAAHDSAMLERLFNSAISVRFFFAPYDERSVCDIFAISSASVLSFRLFT